MTERTNSQRGRDARAAVQKHSIRVNGAANADDLEFLISDLVTDLLHLAKNEGYDPEDVIRRGVRDYECEREERR